MRGSSSEARMKYLSLALFAQRTSNALIEFIHTGKDETMRDMLTQALTSLDQVHKGTTSSVRAFSSYEQVRTLYEAWKPREQVVTLLTALLNQKGTNRQQRQRARRALEFFHQLEKQALLNCERPQEEIPRGIRQLCQTS